MSRDSNTAQAANESREQALPRWSWRSPCPPLSAALVRLAPFRLCPSLATANTHPSRTPAVLLRSGRTHRVVRIGLGGRGLGNEWALNCSKTVQKLPPPLHASQFATRFAIYCWPLRVAASPCNPQSPRRETLQAQGSSSEVNTIRVLPSGDIASCGCPRQEPLRADLTSSGEVATPGLSIGRHHELRVSSS